MTTCAPKGRSDLHRSSDGCLTVEEDHSFGPRSQSHEDGERTPVEHPPPMLETGASLPHPTPSAYYIMRHEKEKEKLRELSRNNSSGGGRVPSSRIRALQEKSVPDSSDEEERTQSNRRPLLNPVLADTPKPSTPALILPATPHPKPPPPPPPLCLPSFSRNNFPGDGRITLSRIRALQEKSVPDSSDEEERTQSNRRQLLNPVLADAPKPSTPALILPATPHPKPPPPPPPPPPPLCLPSFSRNNSPADGRITSSRIRALQVKMALESRRLVTRRNAHGRIGSSS